MAQWLRICLPMQGTQVQSLVWEDPIATEQLSPCALLLSLHSGARVPQLLSPRAATTEVRVPRACALQQEKPLQ